MRRNSIAIATKRFNRLRQNDLTLYQLFQASPKCLHSDLSKQMELKMKSNKNSVRNRSTTRNGSKAIVNGAYGIKKEKMSPNFCHRLDHPYLASSHSSKTRKSKTLQFCAKLCWTNKNQRCSDYLDFRCKKNCLTCLGSRCSANTCGVIRAYVYKSQLSIQLRPVVSALLSSST